MLTFPAWVNTIGGLIQSPIVRYSSEDRSLEKEFITHVFFPFRFVEYKAVSQLTEGHPDNMPIGEETPADQAKLDSLIRFLKERHCVLERDMVIFNERVAPQCWLEKCAFASSFIQFSERLHQFWFSRFVSDAQYVVPGRPVESIQTLTEDVGRRWKTLDFGRLGPGVTCDSRNQPLNEWEEEGLWYPLLEGSVTV